MTNWRDQYKGMKVLSEYKIQLLDEGSKSLSQSWVLGAMYVDWKRLSGFTEPEPPNLQSSFKEWNRGVEGE
tara:strand:+ start:985 stop:1197 length:213 start_codon:yes stop_codon:yes gene_type:complete